MPLGDVTNTPLRAAMTNERLNRLRPASLRLDNTYGQLTPTSTPSSAGSNTSTPTSSAASSPVSPTTAMTGAMRGLGLGSPRRQSLDGERVSRRPTSTITNNARTVSSPTYASNRAIARKNRSRGFTIHSDYDYPSDDASTRTPSAACVTPPQTPVFHTTGPQSPYYNGPRQPFRDITREVLDAGAAVHSHRRSRVCNAGRRVSRYENRENIPPRRTSF